ncbi:2-polyprenyl-3-methyl-5-hydroxy-6-metoxy-1,4-benzoquinol methylase [Paraburkholderia sp. WSM4175]|uniref:class I SAM-dependent methyltransferase n=1 Tax=Paraburkholderia sp. WSM4175 TaxID=2991072 RepID=UPI003D236C0A
MRRIRTWLNQGYRSLKAFPFLAHRLARLEAVAIEQNRHAERLAWLESAVIEHNGRLDRMEASLALIGQRLDHLEASGEDTHRQLAKLRPLLRLIHDESLEFAWMVAAPNWIERAEQRIGRPLAALSPVEREQAFYSYYSEMGGGHSTVLREQYQAYLPLLQKATRAGGRVLDIGCGAGEFLAFLREAQVPAVGVDLSTTEVQRAASAGLDAVHASAEDFLRDTGEQFAGITMFQVIEHLAPAQILPTLEACVKRLMPGGVLLVETINMRHPLAVNGFYTDPTHQKPLSDNYLGFVLQWLGLRDVGVLYTLPEPLAGVCTDEPQRLYANYTVFGFVPHAV